MSRGGWSAGLEYAWEESFYHWKAVYSTICSVWFISSLIIAKKSSSGSPPMVRCIISLQKHVFFHPFPTTVQVSCSFIYLVSDSLAIFSHLLIRFHLWAHLPILQIMLTLWQEPELKMHIRIQNAKVTCDIAQFVGLMFVLFSFLCRFNKSLSKTWGGYTSSQVHTVVPFLFGLQTLKS